MHQTVLSSEKVDSQILQELNDIEEENSELSLFDRVKIANQENSTCVAIRDAIRNKKKSFDEMLLKKFESVENILFFKKKL
jgi:3-methyladenine DNA glycosylase AlkC